MAKTKSVSKVAVTVGDARAMLADETYNEAPVNSMEPELKTQNLKYCGCFYNNQTDLGDGKVDGANIKLIFEVVDGPSKGARFSVKAYLRTVSSNYTEKDKYATERVRELTQLFGVKGNELDDKSILGKLVNAQVAYDIDVKTKAPKMYEGKHLYKVFNIRAPVVSKTANLDADLKA